MRKQLRQLYFGLYIIKRRLMYPKARNKLWFKMRFAFQRQIQIYTSRTQFKLHTQSYDAKAHFFPLYQTGTQYETQVVKIIESHLHAGIDFFDVGCNLGFFTVLAAKLGARVHSFDIDTSVITEAQNNALTNQIHNANFILAAVWSRSGLLVSFQRNSKTRSMNSVDIVSDGSILLPTLALDDYCSQNCIDPAIVKIDVEGAEYHVLQGIKNHLDSVDLLLVEVHPMELSKFGHSPMMITEFLQTQGFKVTILANHRANRETEPLEVTIPSTITENTMVVCIKIK